MKDNKYEKKTCSAISVFDLDRTLINGNTSLLFFYYLQKKFGFSITKACSSLYYVLKHSYFEGSVIHLHKQVFQKYLFKQPRTLFTDCLEDFYQGILPHLLYFPTVCKLKMAQQLGHYTAIFSNSPDFIVEPLAQYFQVDHWESTRYATDQKGDFYEVSSIFDGQAKAESLKNLRELLHVPTKKTYAYSDSIHDLAFLKEAGHAIVVNPDRYLKKISHENQWSII